MTHRAARVKAFCERTIEYQKIINDMRKQEIGMKADAEDLGIPLEENKLLAKLNKNKCDLLSKQSRAKLQVLNVVEATALSPKQARAIDLRYRCAKPWSYIQSKMQYDSRQTVYDIRDSAYEAMAHALDKLYPDWQIGDE